MNTDTHEPDTSTCRLVQADQQFEGRQGLTYAVGISAESVGSKRVHIQMATIPPGARAKAHLHAEHETAIYQLSGVSGCWYGERLEHHATVRAEISSTSPRGYRMFHSTRARMSLASR
jgi:uncharacterized RmlC-like cupin family protein